MAADETRVCHQCFDDEFLKHQIRREGEKHERLTRWSLG